MGVLKKKVLDTVILRSLVLKRKKKGKSSLMKEESKVVVFVCVFVFSSR